MNGLERSGPRARRSSRWGFTGAGAAVGALTGSLAAAALMCAVIALTPATYEAASEISIGPEAIGRTPEHVAFIRSEARLIGSRDLARQAIKDLGVEARPEFNPPSIGRNWIDDALVSFGFLRDPSRVSREERILQAYEDHVTVSVARETGGLRIAVRSEDPVFAAVAANRIADLYLKLRVDLAGEGGAVLSTAATAPPTPQAQGPILLLLGGAAFISTALAGLSRCLWSGRLSEARREPAPEAAFEQPRSLGPTPALEKKTSAARRDPGRGWFDAATRRETRDAQAAAGSAAAILSGRPPHGLRIVAASLTGDAGARPALLGLARQLAQEGHAIVIGFDAPRSPGFPPRPGGEGSASREPPSAAPGLAELLSGEASFAEVIRRDPGSRLHFVAARPGEAFELRDLDGVLDALEPIYDFILMIAPPLDQSDLGKSLAAKADVFALAAPPRPRERAIENAKAELTRCGARDVVVVAAPCRAPAPYDARSAGRDAA